MEHSSTRSATSACSEIGSAAGDSANPARCASTALRSSSSAKSGFPSDRSRTACRSGGESLALPSIVCAINRSSSRFSNRAKRINETAGSRNSCPNHLKSGCAGLSSLSRYVATNSKRLFAARRTSTKSVCTRSTSAQCKSSITTTVVRLVATRSNASAIVSSQSLLFERTRSFARTCAIFSRISRIGRSGRSANSRHALAATNDVRRFSHSLNSPTRRDFPMPGSPPISTRPPCPSPACRRRSLRCASSSVRPTNGRQRIRVEIIQP